MQSFLLIGGGVSSPSGRPIELKAKILLGVEDFQSSENLTASSEIRIGTLRARRLLERPRRRSAACASAQALPAARLRFGVGRRNAKMRRGLLRKRLRWVDLYALLSYAVCGKLAVGIVQLPL